MSPLASTYRCEDLSGTTVLTDSPTQLERCSLLLEELEGDNPQVSHSPSQPSYPQISPSSTTQQALVEEKEINHEYTFTDEEDEPFLEEDPDLVIVPVTPYGGSLLVTVRLNQTRNAHLILDTGATMTVLSNDVALDLGLNASTATQLTTVNTAGGPIQVNVSKISSIRAGTAQVNDVAVAIHDLPDSPAGIDGLLGMSFLNHFLVTLDTNKRQLHLKPRS